MRLGTVGIGPWLRTLFYEWRTSWYSVVTTPTGGEPSVRVVQDTSSMEKAIERHAAALEGLADAVRSLRR